MIMAEPNPYLAFRLSTVNLAPQIRASSRNQKETANVPVDPYGGTYPGDDAVR